MDAPEALPSADEAGVRPMEFAERSSGADEPFDELLCPLSATLFFDPVTLPCGHTFSRAPLFL
jgi:hypothetical protein